MLKTRRLMQEKFRVAAYMRAKWENAIHTHQHHGHYLCILLKLEHRTIGAPQVNQLKNREDIFQLGLCQLTASHSCNADKELFSKILEFDTDRNQTTHTHLTRSQHVVTVVIQRDK